VARHRHAEAATTGHGGDRVNRWNRQIAKLIKRGFILSATDAVDLYARKRWRCASPSDLVIGADPHRRPEAFRVSRPDIDDPLQGMMCVDFSTYMADDILTKVDRASMSVGLEVRCPLLDYRVVDFAWRLPMPMRVNADGGKRILKRVLERYVPKPLFDRPKRGFGVPIEQWLRNDLREWAENLLAPARLKEQGLLNADAVRNAWQEHQGGRISHTNMLWTVLMFQAWHEHWIAQTVPARARAMTA
jgi:asparagine synthase (glutamine-hydrolysing)